MTGFAIIAEVIRRQAAARSCERLVRVAQAGKSQGGIRKWNGKIGSRTTIRADLHSFGFDPAHLGESLQNRFLDRVFGVDIVCNRQAAHAGVCQHAGVFAGTVIPVWGQGLAAGSHRLDGGKMREQVRAAQQVAFLHPNFGLDTLDHFNMLITAFVRGADDGDFFGCQMESLVTAMFNK